VNAEQVARNDAIYRAANERIKSAAEEYEVTGPIPFICECADPGCRDVLLLTMADDEEIRANPRHFVNLPGHDGLAREHVETVRAAPGYIVVEKIGRAGEVVQELDPRQAQHG
jgi:hypothetical protein